MESLTDLSTAVYSSLALLLATFASLFSVVNPLAAAPVFLLLTDQDSDQERNQTARKAAVYMFGILITRSSSMPAVRPNPSHREQAP